MVQRYVYVILTASILTVSQILIKVGMKAHGPISLRTFSDFLHLVRTVLTTPLLLAGVLTGAMSTVLWLTVVSKFNLSEAVPLVSALYYLLILAASVLLLGESVGRSQLVGAILVIAGIYFISGAK